MNLTLVVERGHSVDNWMNDDQFYCKDSSSDATMSSTFFQYTQINVNNMSTAMCVIKSFTAQMADQHGMMSLTSMSSICIIDDNV